MELTREFMSDLLKQKVAVVTFVKKNGDERVMTCTLKADLLPPIEVKENKKEKKVNEEVLAVYDLNAKGWRSFRIDSVRHVDVQSD